MQLCTHRILAADAALRPHTVHPHTLSNALALPPPPPPGGPPLPPPDPRPDLRWRFEDELKGACSALQVGGRGGGGGAYAVVWPCA